jgi:translation initiation factor 2B subunit (eIF-2B alpha/beta/delta family)
MSGAKSFQDEHRAGSGGVARAFLDELERFVMVDRSPDAPTLRAALLEWLRAGQAAQPSMALVHQFAARALAVADTSVARGDAAKDLRAHVAASCDAEREDLARAMRDAAKVAAELVTARDPWIATLSASDGVFAAVEALVKAGRKPRVIVAESRPRLEGRDTARALAEAGIEVWLVADAALPLLVSQASAVWLGADAVTEVGVLNKVGSYTVALAAREHGVPVWTIAVRKKLLPAGTGALGIAEMPAAEIWDEAPEGVRPRNVYFEMVPAALLRGVVVEDAVLGATECAVAARDRELPPELAAPTRR